MSVPYDEQRPGREWNQDDLVCSVVVTRTGRFVAGIVVQKIETHYTPPASYEYQLAASAAEAFFEREVAAKFPASANR